MLMSMHSTCQQYTSSNDVYIVHLLLIKAVARIADHVLIQVNQHNDLLRCSIDVCQNFSCERVDLA